MKLSVSSDSDAKDAMRVHKLDSTQTELFFGLKCRRIMKDLGSDSSASYNEGNECLSLFVYFLNDKQGVIIHQGVTVVAQLVDFP